MKLEHEIQERFINIVTNKNDAYCPSQAHKIYRELIYYRFEEVLEQAFPRFKNYISDAVFSDLIYDFLEVGAKTPILWKVGAEFKNFMIFTKLTDFRELPYLEDLLVFEFLEIEMFMQHYKRQTIIDFDAKAHYQLSEFTMIKTFLYPVHYPEFDTRRDTFEKAEYHVLFYYNDDTNEVMFEEVTPFLKEFLLMLKHSQSLDASIDEISTMYEVEATDVQRVLYPVLEKYNQNHIIVRA